MNPKSRMLTQLAHALSTNRVHHAYIFSGADGASKVHTAQQFGAMLLEYSQLSETDISTFSFLHGPTFRATLEKIEKRLHPDFTWIEPEDKILRVDDVRDLPKQLAYPPLAGKRRVVVVQRAEKLNAAAANALLKILEEPPSYVVFFLICTDVELLLPTLRSRSQLLAFPPLTEAELRRELQRNFPQASAEDLLWAEYWAMGSLERAEKFLLEEAFRLAMKEAGEQLLHIWESPRGIPPALWTFIEGLKNAEAAGYVLLSWLRLARDLNYQVEHRRQKVENPFAGRLYNIAGKLNESAREKCCSMGLALDRAAQDLDLHVNFKLVIANLLGPLRIS